MTAGSAGGGGAAENPRNAAVAATEDSRSGEREFLTSQEAYLSTTFYNCSLLALINILTLTSINQGGQG